MKMWKFQSVDSEIMANRWKTGSGGDIVKESEVDAYDKQGVHVWADGDSEKESIYAERNINKDHV